MELTGDDSVGTNNEAWLKGTERRSQLVLWFKVLSDM
jgi:hypothetical protein